MHSDLKALEFGAVQRLLERLTRTPYGADVARQAQPAPDLAAARRMQAAVTAARAAIDAGEAPPLATLPDVRPALRQAGREGTLLPGTALSHVRTVMQAVAALRPAVAARAALYPGPAEHLEPPAGLMALLDRTILFNGHVREDASPRLAALNDELKGLRGEIADRLVAYARGQNLKEPVKDATQVAWQGARAMLTVSPAEANRLQGVRRGTAPGGRGQLFEPLEVVALNNRLEAVSAQADDARREVLRQVTDALRPHLPRLEAMIGVLSWIDLALAGGQLSADLNAHAPALVDEPRVALDRAYHPAMLFQFAEGHGPRPVPLSIGLDAAHPMLVITGPNAGGKTVALKTLGLLVTMAHCGLHIPADGDCMVGDFSRVIVDIGDPQNLYHQLSTFAGHVEVLKRLLAEADGRTLVLMDELGTGTDPEEGAALAMAVLDELCDREVRGVVTTHLPPLKSYAERHARLTNASMRFDPQRLQPTYQLQIGVGGRSFGLIVAEKRGLPVELVERARRHLHDINPAHEAFAAEPGAAPQR